MQRYRKSVNIGIGALLCVIAYQWIAVAVHPHQLLYDIDWKHPISALETKWLYFYLHALTVFPVLALSFDRRVAYYKNWVYLFPAILVVAVLFIVWDVCFTHWGVWGFNEDYISGIRFLMLPIEEVFFFLTVPYASIFVYECIKYYFPKDTFAGWDTPITWSLISLFTLIGIVYVQHLYTVTTFLGTAVFLAFHQVRFKNTYRTLFYKSYLVILLPFLVINGVLTGGYTQNPVVVYNPDEYLGLRISSVPIDDAVYGFLLLFMIVTWYEWNKRKK